MTLDEIDKSELILESYRIDGISASQCRSIFLDWFLKLPSGVDQIRAINLLQETYAKSAPQHPMSAVLQSALEEPKKLGRRGGRAARVGL